MDFNDKVYELCEKIPKGRISTYKELAKALNSKGYRAVGNALSKNNYSYVPCHRVVSSSGHLHGFAHGLNAKKKLLESEGIKIINNKVIDLKKVLFRFR